MRKLDLTGQRFGRLTAISNASRNGRRTMWLFACDCGREIVMSSDSVTRGLSKSCGCLKAEVTAARSVTHGESVDYKRSREMRAWRHAKERCYNPNCERYPQYGGRGIGMCDEWKNDLSAFVRDMGRCPRGMSLDRIDPNKGYEPGNCRWATNHEQARTRTDNVLVRHGNRTMVLKDFAKEVGVSYKSLHHRMKKTGESAPIAASHLNNT